MDYESIIIEKSKLGDELAWTMLFKQHFKPVYLYCLQLVCGHESQVNRRESDTLFSFKCKTGTLFDSHLALS
jgi:hypothetical protein